MNFGITVASMNPLNKMECASWRAQQNEQQNAEIH